MFRLNVAIGRDRFRELIGHSPAAVAEHQAEFDYSALDRVLPHPLYAAQAWVSILNPGDATGAQARALLSEAHARAVDRHRRRHLREADTGPS